MSSSSFDSVGTLLATIANYLTDALRILSFADKSHWGADEHEQLRAVELALDEAKRDFQQLAPLVNGRANYEHDRKHESIEELRALRGRFSSHIFTLKDWARSGGPINPLWIRETQTLQRDLHRAQCRAAMRIFTSGQEATTRCLGAFLVHRKQRTWSSNQIGMPEGEYHRRYLEELAACNKVGSFVRFGDQDIAFICDFCDGHIVWEDLEGVPTMRAAQEGAGSPVSPISPTTNHPNWQASGISLSNAESKHVVFAPIAIGNHIPPLAMDWQARLTCPFCEMVGALPQDADDDEDPYRPDTAEFEDLAALQEHLEWQHTAAATPATLPVSIPLPSNSCQIM